MKLPAPVEGKHIRLRSAVPDDAPFILDLRLNPELSAFIGQTDPSEEKQRAWIAARLTLPGDYHMIIESHDGHPLGVVAVYNIDETARTFEWGRWVVHPDAPRYTAIESALLCYILAFNELRLTSALFGVMAENGKVISFHQKFGAIETHRDDHAVYFRLTYDDFLPTATRYRRYLSDATILPTP